MLHATTHLPRKPAKARRWLKAEGPDGMFAVSGQTAKTLEALTGAGPVGQTPWEFPRGFRLAAYIHDLRHRHGLSIETLRETSEDGQWRARYVLRSRVRLVEG